MAEKLLGESKEPENITWHTFPEVGRTALTVESGLEPAEAIAKEALLKEARSRALKVAKHHIPSPIHYTKSKNN